MKKIEELINEIEHYKSICEQEETDKNIILNLLRKEKDFILNRDSLLYHVTASAFTLNEDRNKFLMVHHNIYKTWSWIGGHADGEADLFSVACREITEESGIIHFKSNTNHIVSIDILTTKSHYKKEKYVPAHLHLNISYLVIADDKDKLRIKEDENSAVSWIDINKIDTYVEDEEMKILYHKIIRKMSL